MEPIFKAGAVPQNIQAFGPITGPLRTLAQIQSIMAETSQAVFPVSGDCLEGAGVQDGGWVAVDFTRFPAPPRYKSKGGDGSEDLCLCFSVFPGTRTPAVMCKAYSGVWGPWQMVGTRYNLTAGKHRMNCGMVAEQIFGVVFASWGRDGQLLLAQNPANFPEQLGTAPTIHGENVGNPVPMKRTDVPSPSSCKPV